MYPQFPLIVLNFKWLSHEYSVDIGIVEIVENTAAKKSKKQCEIDFIVNKEFKKYYIQSALNYNLKKPPRLIQTLSVGSSRGGFSFYHT